MSFVHRLIVGHFDFGAFVAFRPVPLRSLDLPKTRAMLEEIGESVGGGEYVIDGESLYFRNGYCDCPWLSNRRNEKSEEFAWAIASAESCLFIDTGTGIIFDPAHPDRGASRDALGHDRPELTPLSRAEAEAIERDADPDPLTLAVLRAALSQDDWAEDFCTRLAEHDHFHVRGNSLFALGRMAMRGVRLNRERIQPVIEGAMIDPDLYVSGQARIAAEAVENGLRWVISAFDNGNPELEVATYSNGWIRCPNCGWRYATYDAGAFREGRCMECRQKLRVIPEVT